MPSASPRFTASAESLKKAGIEDFQLDYAVKTLLRTGAPVRAAAAGTTAKPRR